MAIVLGDTSGIAQGISQAGSALGQALMQRGKEQKELLKEQRGRKQTTQEFGALANVLKQINPDLGQIVEDLTQSGETFSKETIQSLFKLFEPQLKEEAKAKGMSNYLSNILGEKTPIQQIRDAPGIGEVTEQAPQQPTRNQIGQPNSITAENGKEITQEKIDEMIAAPYQAIRDLGKSYQDRLNQERKQWMKENAEIRKEERAKINRIIQPFEDINRLQSNVGRANKALDIIKKEDASLDDNFWRTVASAYLEDKGLDSVAATLKTEGQKKLFSVLRPFLNAKEIGGSNPSTREVLLALESNPSAFKGKNTNLYVGKVLLNEAEMLAEKSKIMNELQKDPYISYADFQEQLENRLEPLRKEKDQELKYFGDLQYANQLIKGRKPRAGHIFAFNPETGKVHEEPRDKVNEIRNAGGVILDD